MSRESTGGIHRLTRSMESSESEFGSPDYASYRISVPPTPDNQVPCVEIVLHDPRNKSLSGDDQDDLSEDFEDPKTPLTRNKDFEKWKSLTHTVKISAAVLATYWITVFIRIISLVLFILWRITHQNDDANWLWGMSVTCEIWFSLLWFLDQLTKLRAVSRTTDLELLKQKFETPTPDNPTAKSDLPGIDAFVYTSDSVNEPPLTTANTVLSILAVDYPVEKLSCYVSDDGGSLLMFETMAEAASFAKIWVPFCRKHEIEPRNPESYFGLKRDPYKAKVRPGFVTERRAMKRKYEEFKVRVNALSDSIRRRSDAYNSQEEVRALAELKQRRSDDEYDDDEPNRRLKLPKATWMSDGTYWPGTWTAPAPHHSCCDHPTIIQVLLHPPGDEPVKGFQRNKWLDFSEVDTRLPVLIYVSRERRPGYDHNEKAGAMNALLRGSAVMSNGPFILNLDCDHYIYNSKALREGTCFMVDQNGGRICYVQFPQRFEEIDPSKHYGNSDSILFDINMRALDGIQGPMYAGTGCLFRRTALYGFGPDDDWDDEASNAVLIPKRFGNSDMMLRSIKTVVYQGKPLADTPSGERGRQPWRGLSNPRKHLGVSAVSEAVNLMACWFEDKTEWGTNFGWIYGTVTEDVLTGYMMHNNGWRSVYCTTKPDAFRKTALVNITDGLHLLLRRAMGSVEILFSRNNAILGNPRLKFLQRIAYLNIGFYPFSSIFLIVYCFLPALSLFSGKFMVKSFNLSFLVYLLVITLTSCALAVLETHWSGVTLQEWWRNEQFRFIGGTSSHLVAVIQGILKSMTGIVIPFRLRSKKPRDDQDDEYADLYLIKWTALMIPPLTIILLNVIAIFYGFSRKIYGNGRQWSNFIGGVGFSLWVLIHLYPFARGLMGRRGKAPTILYVWSGLVAITLSLLVLAISPPPETPAGGSILLTPGLN